MKSNSLGVPIVTLSNGIRVANFSSPHDFKFVDGSVLPACTEQRARKMALESREVENENPYAPVTDIKLSWAMSDAVFSELARLKDSDEFDVLLVPLPVMTALKEGDELAPGKCRCIRMADRVNKLSHIDRFCA